MPLDPDRAAFLMEPYRWSEASNATVLAQYANARRVEYETNIATVAGGQALADTLLSLLQGAAHVYEVEAEAVTPFLPLAFDGSPPAFQLAAGEFGETGSQTRLVAAVEVDLTDGVSRVTVRG